MIDFKLSQVLCGSTLNFILVKMKYMNLSKKNNLRVQTALDSQCDLQQLSRLNFCKQLIIQTKLS